MSKGGSLRIETGVEGIEIEIEDQLGFARLRLHACARVLVRSAMRGSGARLTLRSTRKPKREAA
jgi:hypothetical protein